MILQLTLNYALVPEPKPRGRQETKMDRDDEKDPK